MIYLMILKLILSSAGLVGHQVAVGHEHPIHIAEGLMILLFTEGEVFLRGEDAPIPDLGLAQGQDQDQGLLQYQEDLGQGLEKGHDQVQGHHLEGLGQDPDLVIEGHALCPDPASEDQGQGHEDLGQDLGRDLG